MITGVGVFILRIAALSVGFICIELFAPVVAGIGRIVVVEEFDFIFADEIFGVVEFGMIAVAVFINRFFAGTLPCGDSSEKFNFVA